jgi:hypothetical protein
MALILSCLTEDPVRTRHILDRLRQAGWAPTDITVLHPDGPSPAVPPVKPPDETAPETAVVAGGSAAVVAGAFGWVVGYGVLALPAALLGAAVGGAIGATVGASVDEEASLLRSVLAHYGPRISGSRSAILVRAQDSHGYDVVMRIFRSENGQDIQVVGKGRLEAGAARPRT